MSFCIYDTDVALCNNERVIIYDMQSDAENTIQLPDLQSDKKTDLHNNVDIETFHMITNVSYSDDGKYFLVCTNRKQLCLYERKNVTLLSNRTLARAASKVRFSPNNDIIVADKAGDVYIFSTSKPTESGTLLLGHLSMLLDVLITQDERCIITADRDEKIRVSMFPNSYNILAYCLGHTKFVTNICELPHDRTILVSSGGDGIFRLWSYASGEEISSTDFRDKISKSDIEKFNQHLQDCHLEETVEILPVKHLRLLRLDETTSLVIITFHSNALLLVYKISGTVTTSFETMYLQSLTVDDEPIECLFHNENLWTLTYKGFEVYTFKNNMFVLNDNLSLELKRLNNFWDSLKVNTFKQNLFPILYKRKYDNVQEYLERKKMRLGNISE